MKTDNSKKRNSSKCSWSHKHSAYRCCIPALTGLGGVHSQVSAAERRGGDSNPRWLSTIHDFQSCTFDHSDTSPDLPRTEREGFEPSVMQSTTPDFESGSFDHSDISPDETKRIRTSDPQFRKLMLYPAEL